MQATRRFCSLILAATVLGGIVLGGVATATAEDDQQARRNAAMKLYQDGNYKEAYDAFRCSKRWSTCTRKTGGSSRQWPGPT